MNSYVHKPCKPGYYVMDNGTALMARSLCLQGALHYKDGNFARYLQCKWDYELARTTKIILERLCVGVM